MAEEGIETNIMVEQAVTVTGTEAVTVTGTEAVTGTGTEANNEIQRRKLEKTGKVIAGVALNLSGAIIISALANIHKSGSKSHHKLIFKASAIFAILTFLAALGLFISVLYKNINRNVQLGLIIMAIITIFAGVVGLAMNILL